MLTRTKTRRVLSNVFNTFDSIGLSTQYLTMVDDELSHRRIRAFYESLEGICPLAVFAADNSCELVTLVVQPTCLHDTCFLSCTQHIQFS